MFQREESLDGAVYFECLFNNVISPGIRWSALLNKLKKQHCPNLAPHTAGEAFWTCPIKRRPGGRPGTGWGDKTVGLGWLVSPSVAEQRTVWGSLLFVTDVSFARWVAVGWFSQIPLKSWPKLKPTHRYSACLSGNVTWAAQTCVES